MTSAVIRICLIAAIAAATGCRPKNGAAASAGGITGFVTFRGEYARTTGPCIDLGDGMRGTPFVDTFRVVEVLEGRLTAETVCVHAMTEGGAGYPAGLADGRICTVRLALSAETLEQLGDGEGYDLAFLRVDGRDLTAPRPED